MSFIYITCSNKKEAERIAKELLKNRLVACANLWPIFSFYWWKRKITKEREVVLLVKTLKGNYKKIERIVKKLHSYTVPIIAEIEVKRINKKYQKWLEREVLK